MPTAHFSTFFLPEKGKKKELKFCSRTNTSIMKTILCLTTRKQRTNDGQNNKMK